MPTSLKKRAIIMRPKQAIQLILEAQAGWKARINKVRWVKLRLVMIRSDVIGQGYFKASEMNI